MKGCPFCILDQIDVWQGCSTDFHEGVAIAETVLEKNVIDRIKAEGNTPRNAAILVNAVAKARAEAVANVEVVREMLKRYDEAQLPKKKVEPEKEAE